MLNLAVLLANSARELPTKDAIIFGEKRFTYAQIDAASSQVANGLKNNGIKKGDRVALSCLNIPYFPIVYYGILKTGAVVVPLNVLLKKREIAYHLEDSNATAYFCFEGTEELPMGKEGWEGFQEVSSCELFWLITADPSVDSPVDNKATLGMLIEGQEPSFELAETNPEDTAVILYTSGTTGQPKGAELSHSNVVLNTMVAKELMRLVQDDIQLIVLPLFHSFGQVVQMNTGFLAGNSLVLLPKFEPASVFKTLEQENITVFCGVPTMYWGLLTYPGVESQFDLKKIANNLRLVTSAGSSMPVETLRGFQERFQVTVMEGYGLSETSPVVTFNPWEKTKTGSVGRPVWGVDVKIVDKKRNTLPVGEVGEIVVQGHNIMKGYFRRPEATEKAIVHGWFYTGDMGKLDEEGYLYIVDRLKDMIIRGGYNVYPREIEEVLVTHEQITMAAVVGVPHDSHGEEVKAFVILKDGSQLTSEEIISWCKEQMAIYKYPRIVEIRDTLPMTATGKILKKDLKQKVPKMVPDIGK